MRLRTAVELLKATKDIESQLEKVTITFTYFLWNWISCFI
jgi:pimeloyl-ACP methyl ester carboxylesterase